eukprot:g2452.t1
MKFAKLIRRGTLRPSITPLYSTRPLSTVNKCKTIKIINDNGNIEIGDKIIHPLWLRERSISSKSVQAITKQPKLQPHDLVENMKIDSCSLGSDSKTLSVAFSDGYETTFNVDKLLNEIHNFCDHGIQVEDLSIPSYEIDYESTRQPKYYHFNDFFEIATKKKRSNNNNDEIVDVTFENTNPYTKMEAIEALIKDGHFILEGVPSSSGMVEKIGNAITGAKVRSTNWGDSFNVQNKPDGDKQDIAYTADGLPPHVDNPYRDPSPGFQLLHTLENDCTGGDSIAVDGFAVAMELKELNREYFDILTEVGVRWENDGGSQKSALYCVAPHIKLDSSGQSIHQIFYSPKSGGYAPYLPPEKLNVFYKAR